MTLIWVRNVLNTFLQIEVPWLISVLPMLVAILVLLALAGLTLYRRKHKKAPQVLADSTAAAFGKSKARVYEQPKGERPCVTFADVAGADEAKKDLRQVVDFLKNPEKYRRVGAHMPRGVLLVGPPGTGKTLLAKAVAGEGGVPFFSISASEFVEMFAGVGASRVRDLFEQARAAAPAIVFIDEMDAVGRRRSIGVGNVSDEREQTLNQLLVAMDGFTDNTAVILLAATNRPDVLDPALLRSGRFDRQVVVGLPDRLGREAIMLIHTRDLLLSPDIDLGMLAHTTTGFSGADLANLCNEAALQAAEHNHDEISLADFDNARDKIMLGDKRNILIGQDDRRVIAYHESGHALAAWFSPLADSVNRVTVIPHGHTLGITEQRPEEDRYNFSRSYLLTKLTVMLGGRAAEDLAIGDITTGAQNDLREATRLARRMVTEWGMGEVGLAALEYDGEQSFTGYDFPQARHYSETMAARVDLEIDQMLAERYAFAKQILSTHRGELNHLVTTLLEEDTVDHQQLCAILGSSPTLESACLVGAASL